MNKLLAYLSLLIPESLLTNNYLIKRTQYFLENPAACEHDWKVVAKILSTAELQVQCMKCATYSEVTNPSEEEWAAASGAMETPYRWQDKSRIRYYLAG